MKIVFLNPSGELGGAETALLDMLAALREARPSWPLALVASAEGPLIEETRRLGVRADSLEFPAALARLGEWGRRGSGLDRVRLGAQLFTAAVPTASYLRRLRQTISRLAPDIVHTNGLKMHVLGAHAKPADARLVWHLHDYPRSRPITARLLARDAGSCDAVLANSTSVGRQAGTLVDSTRVRTVYNAIDLNRFSPEGPRLDLDGSCGLAPLASGGVRIGLVATFARWKGHRTFLEAVSRVKSPHPFRGYIIGGPIYQTSASQFSFDELRGLARSFGLGDSVGFTGHIRDVPSALRALDIVVHASIEPEPFGLVIAEALACGKAVVASHDGGAAEIGEGAAVFHTPGNAGELAERLTALIGDCKRRVSLGEAGRAIALTRFSRRRLAETLVPIYEALSPSRS